MVEHIDHSSSDSSPGGHRCPSFRRQHATHTLGTTHFTSLATPSRGTPTPRCGRSRWNRTRRRSALADPEEVSWCSRGRVGLDGDRVELPAAATPSSCPRACRSRSRTVAEAPAARSAACRWAGRGAWRTTCSLAVGRVTDRRSVAGPAVRDRVPLADRRSHDEPRQRTWLDVRPASVSCCSHQPCGDHRRPRLAALCATSKQAASSSSTPAGRGRRACERGPPQPAAAGAV